jgi:excisionase family DNA binding protein
LSTADQAAPKVFPAYLRPKEAAQYLGISHSLLAKQVRKNAGPPRRRVGRAVLYSVADLNAWMEARLATPRRVIPQRVRESWKAMKRRCLDPKHVRFKDYGGRGITICDRWLEPKTGLLNFFADMGDRPPGKTLDRFPNNDGNYEPGNSRWATPSEQAGNRRAA